MNNTITKQLVQATSWYGEVCSNLSLVSERALRAEQGRIIRDHPDVANSMYQETAGKFRRKRTSLMGQKKLAEMDIRRLKALRAEERIESKSREKVLVSENGRVDLGMAALEIIRRLTILQESIDRWNDD